MRHAIGIGIVASVLSSSVTILAADQSPGAKREAQQEALKPFGPLVGSWRGTGQLQRGRSQGSWTESASWAWKLSPGSASLEIGVEKGKYLKAAVLKPGVEPDSYTLDATLADGSKRSFAGKGAEGKPLVLTADGSGEGLRRVTLSVPNDFRFLLLLESHPDSGATFTRLGEVGFTRNGVSFAAGESGPVCIVTGGRGTMQVTHAGKTYPVCCSGCRDLFNQDPAAIIAEAEARKAKDKK